MFAKISLTRNSTHETKMVLWPHEYGNNPTAILDNYEAQHPDFVRARNFDEFADSKWAYRLEQNFSEINHSTLLYEWENYRDTAQSYTGLWVASGIIFGLLKSQRPLYEIYAEIQRNLIQTQESKTPYALDRNRVFGYFLSECEAIGVQADGLPSTQTH